LILSALEDSENAIQGSSWQVDGARTSACERKSAMENCFRIFETGFFLPGFEALGKAITFGRDELTNCRYCPVVGYVRLTLANSVEDSMTMVDEHAGDLR
jgi:hypothetical protein